MKTTRESVDPDVVSKMTPADRYAFVSKMREQGQKQFDAVETAADELLAVLDATQKAKASEILPGLAFGPGRCAAHSRAMNSTSTDAETAAQRSSGRHPSVQRVIEHQEASTSSSVKRRISHVDRNVAHPAPGAPAFRLRSGRRWSLPACRDGRKARRQAGQALPIPQLIEARSGEPVTLTLQKTQHRFGSGPAVPSRGISASYLGPVVRVRNGDTIPFRVENRLDEETTLHWHGMLVPSHVDGGPHNTIRPGAVWSPEITIKQPACTAWFHPHPHGNTARQVYSGLAGMMIVSDGADRDRGLPADLRRRRSADRAAGQALRPQRRGSCTSPT